MEKFKFYKWNIKMDLVKLNSFNLNEAKVISMENANNNTHQDTISAIEKNIIPKWVEKLGETGRRGEIIALNYLSTIYNMVEWVSDNARLGYDIVADDIKFEIKSTTGNNNTFCISKHELLTADKFNEQYRLFFIRFDNQMVEGYLFNNLYEILGLSFNEIIKSSAVKVKNDCSITAIDYRVILSDEVLGFAQYIDLSKYGIV